MVDLLPEPKQEVTPYLHHKMGLLKSKDLWVWRGYLNYKRYLRYNTRHVDLHCRLEGDRVNAIGYDDHDSLCYPCEDCFHYLRTYQHGDTSSESSDEDY